MAKVLMAIKPIYVEKILSGEKKFEFRKTLCKRHVSSLVIYATSPIKKVIAEIQISNILTGSPTEIWAKTSYAAGLCKIDFDQYFYNCITAVAYCLGAIQVFNPPLPLDHFGIKHAPQSYCYLSENQLSKDLLKLNN